jgi:hypothetical protein
MRSGLYPTHSLLSYLEQWVSHTKCWKTSNEGINATLCLTDLQKKKNSKWRNVVTSTMKVFLNNRRRDDGATHFRKEEKQCMF